MYLCISFFIPVEVHVEPVETLTAQLYVGFCISAILQNGLALSETVIGLVYTEPLSNVDTFKSRAAALYIRGHILMQRSKCVEVSFSFGPYLFS